MAHSGASLPPAEVRPRTQASVSMGLLRHNSQTTDASSRKRGPGPPLAAAFSGAPAAG